jgi:tetratricopeptide (TPR) repeat protein
MRERIDEMNREVVALLDEGCCQEALPLALETVELARRHLGEDHPDYATSLDNLGVLYQSLDRLSEAEPLYRQALEIRLKALGKGHADYATSLNNLGALYHSRGDYDQAEPLLRQALEVTREALGKEDPAYAAGLDNLAALYVSARDFAQAERLYRQCLEIRRVVLGEDHPDYAISLDNLAYLYASRENYADAEPLFRQALKVRRQALGDEHPDCAASLDTLAELYRAMGDPSRAKRLYRRASRRMAERSIMAERVRHLTRETAALYRQGRYPEALRIGKETVHLATHYLGNCHPGHAASLNNLAGLYQAMGEYAKARRLYRRALKSTHRAFGENHPEYATTLNNLATVYKSLGNNATSERLHRQALEIRRDVLGETHPHYATSLNNLAGVKVSQGNYAEAERLYREALEITRRALGEDHPEYATILNNLAELAREELRQLNKAVVAHCKHGRYEDALLQALFTLNLARERFGELDPTFAISLNNLAFVYHTKGDYAKAEQRYRQALEITQKTLGENNYDYANRMSNLAGLYLDLERYVEAEPLLLRSLEIMCLVLGDGHPHSLSTRSNLAGLYLRQGDYAKAELGYSQALEITREVLGEEHPDYAHRLICLASLYLYTGNYSESETLVRSALKITAKVLGEEHPNYAQSLLVLAKLHSRQRKYSDAEVLYRQALEMLGQALGEWHPHYSVGLNSLALLYQAVGDYSKAKQLYERALHINRINRGVAGENGPNHAALLNNLATMELAMGNLSEAAPLFRGALNIWRELGEEHPDYKQGLSNLARVFVAQEAPLEALALMRRVEGANGRIIGQVFSYASEHQRLAFLQTIQSDLKLLLSLVFQHLGHDPEARALALDLLLRRKALTAEALAEQRDAILSGRYPHLREPLQQLRFRREAIARKMLAGPAVGEDYRDYRETLQRWHVARERLEQDLARQIAEMSLEQRLRAADRRDVALALPDGAALVEFVRFDVFDFHAVPARGEPSWQPARYLAFVMPPGQHDEVRMVDLGEAEEIDQLIDRFREEIAGRENDYHAERRLQTKGHHTPRAPGSDPGQSLRERVFDPVANAVADCRRLILSPDGALACLPFEVLPAGSGGRLIDTYQIGYVASGRDVLRFNVGTFHPPAPPLVVADPNFDFDGTQVPPPSATLLTPAKANRCSRDIHHVAPVTRLPGMGEEGKCIAKRLGVQPWMGDAALEGRLKEIHSPWILHMVSHAFFLKDQPTRPSEGLGGFGEHHGPVGEDPLLRSGLLLAGYNTWLKRQPLPKEAEDGILTAADVIGLDLTDTDLVVLSACDTGLGDVQAGEGVFGLRRAFTVAGARTLVMSLWKVPDEVTQKLMVDFYDRILAGEQKAEALRQAQLALRKDYPTPRHWGAFICQGDPGPLRHPGN